MIEDAENDPKTHLGDSKDDCHLHLVRVGVHQLIICHIPDLYIVTPIYGINNHVILFDSRGPVQRDRVARASWLLEEK